MLDPSFESRHSYGTAADVDLSYHLPAEQVDLDKRLLQDVSHVEQVLPFIDLDPREVGIFDDGRIQLDRRLEREGALRILRVEGQDFHEPASASGSVKAALALMQVQTQPRSFQRDFLDATAAEQVDNRNTVLVEPGRQREDKAACRVQDEVHREVAHFDLSPRGGEHPAVGQEVALWPGNRMIVRPGSESRASEAPGE